MSNLMNYPALIGRKLRSPSVIFRIADELIDPSFQSLSGSVVTTEMSQRDARITIQINQKNTKACNADIYVPFPWRVLIGFIDT